MARYCGNCGTEVDETAVFCPTCGSPIDEAAATDIPAAPAWPEPASSAEPSLDAAAADDDPVPPESAEEPEETSASRWGYAAPAAEAPAERESRAWQRPSEPAESADAPTRVEQRPPEEDPSVPPPIPAAPERAPVGPWSDRDRPTERPASSSESGPQVDLPFTMPVTLSGWLIGIGSLLAVLGLLVILVSRTVNVIDLLLLVAMLGVAATVFLSARMPAIPHLRLISLAVALVAFGVALDRVAVTGGGAGELLLFMGSAAAGIGAVLLELGQDQPLGGPQR